MLGAEVDAELLTFDETAFEPVLSTARFTKTE
jgi:hypothetical protein